MRQSDSALRAVLQAQIGEIVDAMLAKKAAPDQITLGEIEQVVTVAGKKVQAALTAGLVAQASEADRSAVGPVCTHCGQAMHYKGQKMKYVATETGEVQVKRAYYYCATCRAGVFPPRSAVAIGGEPV